MQQEASPVATTPGGSNPLPVEGDPRYGYRVIRYSVTPREQQLQQERLTESWGHARPNSVLVAAIGNHWKPGSWQKVVDMVHYSNAQGLYCALEEIMDRCFNPYDALGCMRNEAALRASQGYEWLCMVDNDVYPDPDALVRLVSRGHPIIAPYVAEPSTGKPLHGPHQKPFMGVRPVRWCVLSMLIIKTAVFHATGPELWNDSIGADEGYHFQKLWHFGYQPWLDTEIVLRVADNPTYPLAQLRAAKADAEAFWERRRQWLLAMPNRQPINPADPHVTPDGEYLPFLQPVQVPSQNGQATQAVSGTVTPSVEGTQGDGQLDEARLRDLELAREGVAHEKPG